MNKAVKCAKDYHWSTVYVRNRIKGHVLDFDHYPVPVKSYDFFNQTKISQGNSPDDGVSLGDAFCFKTGGTKKAVPELSTLSGILFYAYGVTQRFLFGRIPVFKRPVPSAGGLYPCHLYVLVRGSTQIETGLYYCDMIHQRLGLIQNIRDESDKHPQDLLFFISGQPDISSWKYRDRAFRYVLLDAGHLAEGLQLALTAFGYEGRFDCAVGNSNLSKLLSVDGIREIPVCTVSTVKSGHLPVMEGKPARSNEPDFKRPIYPLLESVLQIYQNHRQSAGLVNPVPMSGSLQPQGPGLEMSYRKAVLERSSRRNFNSGTLKYGDAAQLIRTAASLIVQSDTDRESTLSDLDVGFVCENIENMESGLYYISKEDGRPQSVQKGHFHKFIAHICLDQMWMANAAMQFVFVSDLKSLEQNWGPQGYARVLVHAGRVAHRIYLAAQALGLGCCAVGALYDHEAQELFDLNQDQALFYVVAVGRVKD